MMPAKYRRIGFAALQFLGTPDSCKAMHAFLGYRHDEDDIDCGDPLSVPNFASDEVAPGEWVAKDPHGEFAVYTDEEFRAQFERVEENTEESA